jgi:ketosteroid isomerase-like protein
MAGEPASPERNANVDLVYAGMDAFNRGDDEAVRALLDPEIECHVDPALMNGGTWHGVDGYGQMMATWGEAWQEIEMTILGVETPDDRHAIAEVHQRAVGAGSGVPVEMRLAYFYEIRDGRALRFHVYPDRDAALAAIG